MIHLKFKEGVKIEKGSLSFFSLSLVWEPPPSLLQTSLKRLEEGILESDLASSWHEDGNLPEFYFFLNQLHRHALLSLSVDPLISLTLQAPLKTVSDKTTFQLSRFVYMRSESGTLIWESPRTGAKLVIRDPKILPLFGALAKEKSREELEREFPQFSKESLLAILSLMDQGGFFNEGEEDFPLVMWEFHDLLFHAKSRMGRQEGPFGGTFRFLGKFPPLAAVRPREEGEVIPLFRPDLQALSLKDAPFSQVLENRRSVRNHATLPLTVQQLGEFLYRSARIQRKHEKGHYESLERPCPGGGGCHELEIYPLIFQCRGLSKGLYRYDPQEHLLVRRAFWSCDLKKLLEEAMEASAKKELPQVLFLLAARFQRVSWKYQSMAYALILKNAGALIQTFYLVATAMKLAPCAIGSGNSDLFARAAGTSYYEETTVAEFMLGSSSTGKKVY